MLSNDIKITKPWTPIASETALLKNNRDGFSGTLNGGGYKIYGLNTYVERQRQMYGLFGMISGGSVFSLIVDGSIKSDGGYAGAIAAVNYGYVENCRTEGTISAENADSIFAGGITGANYGYINRRVTAQKTAAFCRGNYFRKLRIYQRLRFGNGYLCFRKRCNGRRNFGVSGKLH